MACFGLCKVQLKKITTTGKTKWKGNDPACKVDEKKKKDCIAEDVAKRVEPIPLDPNCSTNCRCRVVEEHLSTPELEWFPVNIPYYCEEPFRMGTAILLYEAQVQDGWGDVVCKDEEPKLRVP